MRNRRLVNVMAVDAFLVRADLRGADLRGADLHAAQMVEAKLQNADLSYANLTEAHLDGASVNAETRWAGADLEGADFSGVQDLRASNVHEATNWFLARYSPDVEDQLAIAGRVTRRMGIWHVDLSGYTTYELVMKRGKLRGASFQGARVKKANFEGADLRYAYFGGTVFEDAVFRDANVAFADFRGALGIQREAIQQAQNWQDAYWDPDMGKLLGLPSDRNQALMSVDFRDRKFGNAVLRELKLNGANFARADLSGADLRFSFLRDANFEQANLENADLRGATGLTFEQLRKGVKTAAARLPPPFDPNWFR